MEPIFKVGDRVTVLDSNKSRSDRYFYSFTDDMVEECGGKTFTIKRVVKDSHSSTESECLPDDGAKYYLEGTDWSFASSMFKETHKMKRTDVKVNSLVEFEKLYADLLAHDCVEEWSLEKWKREFAEVQEYYDKDPSDNTPAFPTVICYVDLSWQTKKQCWYMEDRGCLMDEIKSYYEIIGETTIIPTINDLPW